MKSDSPEMLERLLARGRDPDSRLLLRGGYILSMDARVGDLVGDVLIGGDTIEAVGPELRPGGDTLVLDVRGRIVLPGFVDSHVHAWEGAIRGIAPGADFGNYMAITHGGVAKDMSPEDIAIGQRVTVAQALNGGVTTIVDNSHNSRSAEHSDAAIAALAETASGCARGGSPTAGAAGTQLPADLLRLRDAYFSSDDQLLRLRMFDITPSPATWRFAAERARRRCRDGDVDSRSRQPARDGVDARGPHLQPLLRPDRRPVDADRRQRSRDQRGARSDSQFGLGAFVPILQANRLGLQEGISCDNELSYGHDMFSEMRTLLTVQRGPPSQRSSAANPMSRRGTTHATSCGQRPSAVPAMPGSQTDRQPDAGEEGRRRRPRSRPGSDPALRLARRHRRQLRRRRERGHRLRRRRREEVARHVDRSRLRLRRQRCGGEPRVTAQRVRAVSRGRSLRPRG